MKGFEGNPREKVTFHKRATGNQNPSKGEEKDYPSILAGTTVLNTA